ncbi:MAG: hypothetical protein EZS28_050297, partial [Streblomastix strix]
DLLQYRPAIFCNVPKPVIKEIRERWSLKATSYIDDILLMDQDKEKLGREPEKGVRISGLGMEFGEEGSLHSEVEARKTEKEHQELDGVDKERQRSQSQYDCCNLTGAEFLEDFVRGCVFTSKCNQQVENKSVNRGGLEWEILLNEENQGRFGQGKKESQGELTLQLRGDIVGDLGVGLNALGSGGSLVQNNELGKLQQTGVDCSAEGNGEVFSDVNKQKDAIDLNGQCGGRICDQAMASQKGDAGDRQKDQGVAGEFGNRALDEAYTCIRQPNGRLAKQVGEKWVSGM